MRGLVNAALSRWAIRHQASTAGAYLFPLNLGLLTAVFLDLADGLLWALLLAAVLLYKGRRPHLAALALTLAVFTKEPP